MQHSSSYTASSRVCGRAAASWLVVFLDKLGGCLSRQLIDSTTGLNSTFVPKQGVIGTPPAVGPAEEKPELAGLKRLTPHPSFASHARGRWFEPSRAHRLKAPVCGPFACQAP